MYHYTEERESLFTEQGQVMFLKIRDRAHQLLGVSGAMTMGKAISSATGNSFMMLACVDRMVELGEIKEIHRPGCSGQDRVFVSNRRD